ncbi:hypothetical protein [Roseateles sp.]|uniref:hypothetical protein n=1 Tax=Roseateles sp. TaxID=1971397 RepID=UPI0031D61528
MKLFAQSPTGDRAEISDGHKPEASAPVRLPPYGMTVARRVDQFTAHLPAAQELKRELDESVISDAPWERTVPGHADKRPLSKYSLIDCDGVPGLHLHGSVLIDGTWLMTTPTAHEAFACAAMSRAGIEQILSLCPAAPPRGAPLSWVPEGVDFVADRSAGVERLDGHGLKRGEPMAMQARYRVSAQAAGAAEVKELTLLQIPMLRPRRQTDPEEVIEALSLLPLGLEGRTVIVAPDLGDEAAIVAGGLALARRIARAPLGRLSNQALDDLLLEICMQIRTNCSSTLFAHADQLATLRYLAHELRGQQERQARIDRNAGIAAALVENVRFEIPGDSVAAEASAHAKQSMLRDAARTRPDRGDLRVRIKDQSEQAASPGSDIASSR